MVMRQRVPECVGTRPRRKNYQLKLTYNRFVEPSLEREPLCSVPTLLLRCLPTRVFRAEDLQTGASREFHSGFRLPRGNPGSRLLGTYGPAKRQSGSRRMLGPSRSPTAGDILCLLQRLPQNRLDRAELGGP